ncbi:MAG: hypothetical protein ACOH5I_15605 [Oligoflexus sp.]
MKIAAQKHKYQTGMLSKQWLVMLSLASMLLHCSSAKDKDPSENYSQKSDSESLAKEQDLCHSGIGLLLNFDAPPPDYVDVLWETEDFPKQSIYNDCNPLAVEDIQFTKKDFSIYLEDRRYGRSVASFYSLQVVNCETGQLLIDLPIQKVNKNEEDSCKLYLDVFHIKPDFSLSLN